VDFLQIDVFADRPFTGNPLAVFPDAADLTTTQMQAIAREMNLSETTFVTEWDAESYHVRIFTPTEELPFAGHPTIGTTWAMLHLSRAKGARIAQHSKAGTTWVISEGNEVWFSRTGEVGSDLTDSDPDSNYRIAAALGLEADEIGLDGSALDRRGRLEAATADAGLEWLMVPLRDERSLRRCAPDPTALNAVTPVGAYCFTAGGPATLRSRSFPTVGITEDPGTGSAAADLGIYLADRLGPVDIEVLQGVEMGRPCRLFVKAAEDEVRVGGRCELVFKARLERLPED
jgi:trans-2,3-dihydro-3-hydroxyanthranilate isomerase